jgi:hypothetical protein
MDWAVLMSICSVIAIVAIYYVFVHKPDDRRLGIRS